MWPSLDHPTDAFRRALDDAAASVTVADARLASMWRHLATRADTDDALEVALTDVRDALERVHDDVRVLAVLARNGNATHTGG